MKVRYSYLPQQFVAPEEIFEDIRNHLKACNFTLGPEVDEFENSFAALIGTEYAVGVGSGTDSLILSLRALGIGQGDEVITAANTFIATVGAINAVGARPVLVDVTSYFTIDPTRVETAITPKTRVIMPVHLTGEPADMNPIMDFARKHQIAVVEDACQGIGAAIDGRNVGTFGEAAGFSLHPLKNLNVWGDGGVVVTGSKAINDQIRLLRNHGLRSRDEVEVLGFNSRLDSIQAIVGNWLIKNVRAITERRILNAAIYDQALKDVAEIRIPLRRPNARRVFHLYIIEVKERDRLYRYLNEQGIQAKIHYPIPLHLQKGLSHLGYKSGDFPVSEWHAANTITLPVDQHLSEEEIAYTIDTIKRFYRSHSTKMDHVLKPLRQEQVRSTSHVTYTDFPAQFEFSRKDILKELERVLSKGDFILGEEVDVFEKRFAQLCGVKHAVGVASGTDALILALKSLEIGPGDEVITVPNSFVASAACIASVGAHPVFVDVRDDMNMDPDLIEGAITPRTRAILPVHLTGKCADMEPILEIAERHGLHVVEDAAQAVDAQYKGRKAGSFGILGCFSLHPLKNLNAIGDGGIITTNDDLLMEKLRLLRNHGLRNRDEVTIWGLNSRLDSIQAAILNYRLNQLKEITETRRRFAETYRNALGRWVECPVESVGEYPVYHLFVIQCDARDELKVFLEHKGIDTRVHYPIPIHLQICSVELGYRQGDFPVCERQSKRILSLPMHHCLTSAQVNHVCDSIADFYKGRQSLSREKERVVTSGSLS